MSGVITHRVGAFTVTLRPAIRRVTMAGRGRVEAFGFDDIPERLRFYRFLADCSRTGDLYLGDVAAWERAARVVAQIDRRAAA